VDCVLEIGGTLLVAQLVEALSYKPEGGGSDSRWCHWNYSLTLSFRPHKALGVDSALNRNEYQEYVLGSKSGRYVRLTTLPPSCADCYEIWETEDLSRPIGDSLLTYSLTYLFTTHSM